MKCENCGSKELTEGSLEGVSFQPLSQSRKIFSKGVYGINVNVCLKCGSLFNFKADLATLKEIGS